MFPEIDRDRQSGLYFKQMPVYLETNMHQYTKCIPACANLGPNCEVSTGWYKNSSLKVQADHAHIQKHPCTSWDAQPVMFTFTSSKTLTLLSSYLLFALINQIHTNWLAY